MKRWTVVAVLAGLLVATPALADDDPRLRVTGTTLADFEQKLFGQPQQGGTPQGNAPQGGLAQGTTPFEARFRDVSATNQQQLLDDIQKLNNIPPGSRVRLEGQINGRPFKAEVRNHEGVRRVELRGVQFQNEAAAKTFVNSLGGADRVRVRGVLANGQRFDARFRTHDGRVEQRFRVKQPENEHHGTVITSASGRSQVEGARVKHEMKHEMENEHARRFGDDHGRKFNDAGRRSTSGSGHDFSSSGKSFSGASSGSSGKSGDGGGGRHGGRGKD